MVAPSAYAPEAKVWLTSLADISDNSHMVFDYIHRLPQALGGTQRQMATLTLGKIHPFPEGVCFELLPKQIMHKVRFNDTEFHGTWSICRFSGDLLCNFRYTTLLTPYDHHFRWGTAVGPDGCYREFWHCKKREFCRDLSADLRYEDLEHDVWIIPRHRAVLPKRQLEEPKETLGVTRACS